MVFWMPSARPLQYGPAYSVIAVDSNPLSSTAITAAATMTTTSSRQPTRSIRPSRNMLSAAAIATVRSGRIREPTRSDHRPARMRPTAPSNWEIVTSAPADAIDQLWSLINQTNMNVTVTVCGIISSDDVMWMRRNTFGLRRYGLASSSSVAAARGLRGGSITPIALATADTVHINAGNIRPATGPRSASSGITKAPKAIPTGCAVWRIPIASPR
ncbi:hypothetical protein MFM001_28310 [Mycobacterium sp. MFM001]|nr:hypothetical protein MFM001_28310 [Mycobacterium sp. MFM001]